MTRHPETTVTDHDFTLYIDTRFLSPYAMSAFIALTEKGVPFQLKKIDLQTREHLEADYARLSATSRIPTLTDGEFRLSESSAIAEYPVRTGFTETKRRLVHRRHRPCADAQSPRHER